MGMVLQIDDLELGMFVTIHTGRIIEKEKWCTNDFSPLPKITIDRQEDRSFKGRVLEIVAINIPYIIVKRHREGLMKSDKADFEYETLDTREYKFMKLTKEYIKILFPELVK